MATKKPKATITEIVAKQNRLIDDAVGELRTDIASMIGRVLPDVQSWLAGRLMVGGQDAVPPGPKSAATLRLLMRQVLTGMKRAKLDARLEAWSDTFARQMPLFDEVLGLMGLPAMKWAKSDISWLANSKLSAEDQVRGVIESAAREVQTRALMQVSGLKLSELYRVMNERMQMAPATAASVADTSATIFLRSVHERGYAAIERDADPLRFRFVGPHDKLERPFCDAVAHTGKGIDRQQGKRRIFAPPAAADGSYTREEIERMDNGQIPNAMLSGGGYRCRHQWIPVSIAPGPAATRPAPAPKAERPKIEEAPRFAPTADPRLVSQVGHALADVPEDVKRLFGIVPDLGLVEVAGTAGYDPRSRVMRVRPSTPRDVFAHEFFHHVDYSLASNGHETVSVDRSTVIGRALVDESKRLSDSRVRDHLKSILVGRERPDLFVEDLYGSLSLNQVGQGHPLAYYLSDPDRRFREAFANLGTLFSRQDREAWEFISRESGAMAQSFADWLKSL